MFSQGIPFEQDFMVRFGLVQDYITVYTFRWGIEVGAMELSIKNNHCIHSPTDTDKTQHSFCWEDPLKSSGDQK